MKLFSKNDNFFVCEHCGKDVLPLNYTSRDHCPYCLYSKHVDINPGDRLNDCKGLLKPINELDTGKKHMQIEYICTKLAVIATISGLKCFNIYLRVLPFIVKSHICTSTSFLLHMALIYSSSSGSVVIRDNLVKTLLNSGLTNKTLTTIPP